MGTERGELVVESEERAHRRRRMSGRDPHESLRVSTPLELLYDLTFAVAFGTAATQLARYLAADHVRTAIVAFLFGAFAVCWAWVNYSWFASAYDTDDWVCRLLAIAQLPVVTSLTLATGLLLIELGGPWIAERKRKRAGHRGIRTTSPNAMDCW